MQTDFTPSEEIIPQKKSTHELGVEGEDKAVSYLLSNGYSVVERNFRTREGEVDIIALGKTRKENDTLVFFEVKSLAHGSLENLSYLVNRIKQEKIIKTAKCYLKKYRQYSDRYIRFDVLAIDAPGENPVHHIVNAFSE